MRKFFNHNLHKACVHYMQEKCRESNKQNATHVFLFFSGNWPVVLNLLNDYGYQLMLSKYLKVLLHETNCLHLDSSLG